MLARVNTKETSILLRDYKNLMRDENHCQYKHLLKQVCSDFEWNSIDLDEGFQKLAECIVFFSAEKFAPLKRPLLNKKNWATNKFKKKINQSRICGKGVGLSLFPSDSRSLESYEQFVRK